MGGRWQSQKWMSPCDFRLQPAVRGAIFTWLLSVSFQTTVQRSVYAPTYHHPPPKSPIFEAESHSSHERKCFISLNSSCKTISTAHDVQLTTSQDQCQSFFFSCTLWAVKYTDTEKDYHVLHKCPHLHIYVYPDMCAPSAVSRT